MDPNITENLINAANLPTLWITIIVGSSAGIIVYAFGKVCDFVSRKWTEPKLRVEFDQNIRGCITYTTTNDGRLAATVRMKATNHGKRAARGCVTYLTNVEKQNENGDFESTGYCDSIRLAWSCQEQRSGRFGPMDIPREVNQYIDIVSLGEKDNNFHLQLEIFLNRYSKLFQETGTFLFTVHVHAENANPEKCQLVFIWRHPWDGSRDSDAFEALSYKD
jgi:hypothetical protein